MKRIVIIIGIVIMAAVSPALAKEEIEPAAPTKQELTWEKKYLEERYRAIQANIKLEQQEMASVAARFVEVEKQLKAIEDKEKPKDGKVKK